MRTGAHGGRNDDLGLYLEALFVRARPSTLIELRWRTTRGMSRRFIRAAERDRLAPMIASLATVTDVYVAVLPRWRRSGGSSAVVGDCRTVWIDLDTEHARQALEPVDPSPSVRVASGGPGHLHAYWSLRRAVAPSLIERANRRLAWALGGDLASTDAARILRPPQTVHHPRGGAPVRLISAEPGRDCRLEELIAGLPDPPASVAPADRTRAHRRVVGDPLMALPPERYVLALTGQRVGRDRKVRCPLHPDRTPSLHVYEDPARGWYCFGCRRGGSVYDLAGALWSSGPSTGAGGRSLRGPRFLEVRDRLDALLLDRDPPV